MKLLPYQIGEPGCIDCDGRECDGTGKGRIDRCEDNRSGYTDRTIMDVSGRKSVEPEYLSYIRK